MWLRDLLVRLRLRVCGLKNRRQWFTTEQEGDLTCPVCGQDGEEEAHFIFRCKAYSDLRKNYRIFDSPKTNCRMNNVSALLASKNEIEITALATFITEAMKVMGKESRKQLTALPVTMRMIVDYGMVLSLIHI